MVSVVTTPQADADIRRIDTWWAENRPAAPALFAEELAELFALLAIYPELGRPHPHRRIASLRRALLRATQHHVYYAFDGRWVIVLSVWSTVRGRGPRLRRP